MAANKPEVLLLCTHNAGRSVCPCAAGPLRAGARRRALRRIGPRTDLNPSIVALLRERGLDASKEFAKPLTDQMARNAEVVVTMGCGDACPFYPGKRYVDWDLRDPATLTVAEVRPIVDEFDRRVRALLDELV